MTLWLFFDFLSIFFRMKHVRCMCSFVRHVPGKEALLFKNCSGKWVKRARASARARALASERALEGRNDNESPIRPSIQSAESNFIKFPNTIVKKRPTFLAFMTKTIWLASSGGSSRGSSTSDKALNRVLQVTSRARIGHHKV